MKSRRPLVIDKVLKEGKAVMELIIAFWTDKAPPVAYISVLPGLFPPMKSICFCNKDPAWLGAIHKAVSIAAITRDRSNLFVIISPYLDLDQVYRRFRPPKLVQALWAG
jgi:hypothetical protein